MTELIELIEGYAPQSNRVLKQLAAMVLHYPELFACVLSFLHVQQKGLTLDEDRRPACKGLRDHEFSRCGALARMLATNAGLARGPWGAQVHSFLRRAAFRWSASIQHRLLQSERGRAIKDEEYESNYTLHPDSRIGEVDGDMPYGLDDAISLRTLNAEIEIFLYRRRLQKGDIGMGGKRVYSFGARWTLDVEYANGDVATVVTTEVEIRWVGWRPYISSSSGRFELDEIKAISFNLQTDADMPDVPVNPMTKRMRHELIAAARQLLDAIA